VRTRELPCDDCAEVTPFEQPPCPDGHGDACPEWACVRCGSALLVEPPRPRYRRTRATAPALPSAA
jgi:hypothetical protein